MKEIKQIIFKPFLFICIGLMTLTLVSAAAYDHQEMLKLLTGGKMDVQ